jgi:hypothetical protein
MSSYDWHNGPSHARNATAGMTPATETDPQKQKGLINVDTLWLPPQIMLAPVNALKHGSGPQSLITGHDNPQSYRQPPPPT